MWKGEEKEKKKKERNKRSFLTVETHMYSFTGINRFAYLGPYETKLQTFWDVFKGRGVSKKERGGKKERKKGRKQKKQI